jgi:RNA polymerase sigma-70 factor (ECF subfamily)
MSSGAIDPLDRLFSQRTIDFVVRSLARLGARSSDLEDLAQDVMVIALSKWRTFDPALALEPWLWGIARNRLRDFRDLARHRVEVAAETEAATEATAAAGVNGADVLLARRLHQALAELSEEVQPVIVLHDLEAWTLPECARALGVTLDVAKYRLSVGRQALRKQLDALAIERSQWVDG